MGKPNRRQREQARRQRRAERRAQGTNGPALKPEAPCVGSSGADPVRGATAAIIDKDLCWHMVRTVPMLGPLGRKHLDEALTKRAVQAHRPRSNEVVVRRGRRVIRRVPLLVRTIIVGVRDAAHLDEVGAMPGVAEVVCLPAPDPSANGNICGCDAFVMKPARLDPDVLQEFMVRLAANEIVKPVGIGVGDKVLVLDGPMASFTGTIEVLLPDDRIRVAVGLFGGATSADFDIAQVQKIW